MLMWKLYIIGFMRLVKALTCGKIDVSASIKTQTFFRKLLVFFDDVDTVDLCTVNWNVQYNRNNQTYRMLISVCYLVAKVCFRHRPMGAPG